jgi:hypothetical protein
MQFPLIKQTFCALVAVVFLSGCAVANPYWTVGAGVLLGPQVATGKNTFQYMSEWFGPSCESYSIYDTPPRCVR